MKIVKLIDIDLLESSVAASSYSEYDATHTYATDDNVKVSFESDGTTPRTPIEEYVSLADSNLDNYPPDSATKWSLLGASNRWKMFDGYVNTQTSDNQSIIVEIDSSNTNKVGLFDLQGTDVTLSQIVNTELFTDGDCSSDSFTKGTGWSHDAGNEEYDCDGTQTADSKLYQDVSTTETKKYIVKFTVKNYSAGNIAPMVGGTVGTNVSANGAYAEIITAGSAAEDGVVADADFIGSVDDLSIMRISNDETIEIDLDESFTTDYWYYFFADFTYKEDLSWEYSFYSNSKLRIEITTQGGYAKCGMCALGRMVTLGPTSNVEPRIGIEDYSRKDTDSLGRTYLSQGSYKKKNEFDFWIDNVDVDLVRRALADVRGTPIISDANNDETDYGSLVIYGFVKNFDIVIPGSKLSKCSIEIEGLI